jgi:hypothetical protein
MTLVILLILAVLAVNIWYYISLQTAMDAISQRNRSMSGGLVWLNIIPVFGFIWAFVFNSALKKSYEVEFKELGVNERVSLVSGILYPAFNLLFVIFNYTVPYLMYGTYDFQYLYYSRDGLLIIVLAIIFLLANLVFWIIFWVNVAGLKNKLQSFSFSMEPNILDNSMIHSEKNREKVNISSNYASSVSEKQMPTSKPMVNRSSVTSEESAIDKIKKYHDLLKDGLISQEEFERIKKEIIENDK